MFVWLVGDQKLASGKSHSKRLWSATFFVLGDFMIDFTPFRLYFNDPKMWLHLYFEWDCFFQTWSGTNWELFCGLKWWGSISHNHPPNFFSGDFRGPTFEKMLLRQKYGVFFVGRGWLFSWFVCWVDKIYIFLFL